MIGFVAAITASLAVIILVVISSLIGFVQSIIPTTGIVKIDENTYRYNMKSPYITHSLLQDLVVIISDMSFSNRIKSYQTGCNYGFNVDQDEMKRIATYNYLAVNQFFAGTFPIDYIVVSEQDDKMNNCYIDMHLYAESDIQSQTNAEVKKQIYSSNKNNGGSDG